MLRPPTRKRGRAVAGSDSRGGSRRRADAEQGRYALGYHEVPFDANGRIVNGTRVLPERLPADADPVLAAFFEHRHDRAPPDHARARRERPLALLLGRRAQGGVQPEELVIVPDADHVDLYDNRKKIPFDRFEAFFKQHLA